jgi:ferredoxin-thioredoxin reductase catalytic subunit
MPHVNVNNQEIKILAFTKEHGYILTPLGWGKHLTQIAKHSHCPCDFKRSECPCQECEQEVHDTGHCKCSLFWQSYDTYLGQCYPDDWPAKKH